MLKKIKKKIQKEPTFTRLLFQVPSIAMLANSGIKLTKTWLSLPFYILLSYLNSEHPSVQLIVSFIISNSNFRFMLKILLPLFFQRKMNEIFLNKIYLQVVKQKTFRRFILSKGKKDGQNWFHRSSLYVIRRDIVNANHF